MKKLLLLSVIVASIIGATSCKSNPSKEELTQNAIEEYVKPLLNDASSYEFVSLKLLDSISFSDNYEYRKDQFTHNIAYATSHYEDQMRYKNDKYLKSMYNKQDADKYKNEIDLNNQILAGLDSIAKVLGEKMNNIASYTYAYSFRSTNALGAKVINNYYVQISPKDSVQKITEDDKDLIVNPDDFPGYRSYVRKMQTR